MYRRVKRRPSEARADGSLHVNDDAAERQRAKRARRSSVGSYRSRRSSSVGSRSASRSVRSRRLSVAIGWGLSQENQPKKAKKSSSELQALYEQTVELVARNKISEKNAWNCQALEYTKEMVKEAVGDGLNANWQKTGVIIDAGSKFFAVRADQVFKQGQKLRMNMLKDLKTREKEDKQEEAKANRRRANKKTLSEENKITQKLECAKEDPMYTKMSETFDAGCVSGLLVNTLRAQDQGELVFCGDHKLSQFLPNYITQMDSTDASYALSKFKPGKKSVTKVCSLISVMKSQIEYFKSDAGYESDDDMFEQDQTPSSDDEDMGLPDFAPEGEENVPDKAELTENQDMDDFAPPSAVDDVIDDIHDGGMLGPPEPLPMSQSQSQQIEENASVEVQPLEEIRSDAQNIDAETLFSYWQTHAWANQQQWGKASRIKKLRDQAKERKQNQSDGVEKKKRKKRKEDWFDFKNPPELEEYQKRKFKNAPHRNQFKIKPAEWEVLKENDHTLPKDFKLKEDMFYTPFLLPKKVQWSSQQDDISGPSDPLEFEDGHFIAGDLENDIPDCGPPIEDSDDEEPQPPLEDDDDILEVPKTQKQDKIFVPFEAKASTINIRALKSTLYKVFQDVAKESTDGTIEFSEIIDRLNKTLKPKTLKRLTPHLVFITLLYLCNDKGLLLSQTLPKLHSGDPVPQFTVKEVGLEYSGDD